MKTIILKKMHFLNFKGLRELEIEFDEKSTSIYGRNGSGKTTVFDGFTWVLFGKDSFDRKTFDIKTLDIHGVAIPRLPHEVSVILSVDGEEVTLCRRYKESMLVRLEVELVASPLARAKHSARYHLRLFADNFGIVPWRLAEGDGTVFFTDDGSVHLLGVEELLLCCLFHNCNHLFKRLIMLVDSHTVDIQAVGSISDVHRLSQRVTIDFFQYHTSPG